jgi:hypothetical protein
VATTCDRRWRSCADRSGVRLLCPLGSTPGDSVAPLERLCFLFLLWTTRVAQVAV